MAKTSKLYFVDMEDAHGRLAPRLVQRRITRVTPLYVWLAQYEPVSCRSRLRHEDADKHNTPEKALATAIERASHEIDRQERQLVEARERYHTLVDLERAQEKQGA